MSRFRQIDGKLKSFAGKLNAQLLTSGSTFQLNGVSLPADSVEERRIVWFEGEMGKAIIIYPNFLDRTVSNPAWDLIDLAWLEHVSAGSKEKPLWEKYLLKKVEFEEVEKNIDQLLDTSIENLKKVTLQDLK